MTTENKLPCPICTNISTIAQNKFVLQYDCPLCGHYEILSRVIDDLFRFSNHILSGVARNYWESQQERFYFSAEVLQSIESFINATPFPIPAETNIPAKADLVLRYLKMKSRFPGEYTEFIPKTDYSISFSKTYQEFIYCYEYLQEQQLIQKNPSTSSSNFRITPKGWAYLSGIGSEPRDQGFIAMAFSIPTADSLHIDGLIPGIGNAGYTPMRIDSKEHNNRIDDEIVAEIRKSKFVVADLTDKNAGAYFEAGFAMGLGKPVIWTCKEQELKENKIHFDTRQYSIVTWKESNMPDFAKRLTQRIEATIGHGAHKKETAS